MKPRLTMTLVLCTMGGCAGQDDPPGSQGVQAAELARHNAFWDEVRTYGDWVEHKPTLRELAESADAAVVARLVSVEPGRVVQNTPEDFYSELLVHAEVSEPLRDASATETVTFSVPVSAGSLSERDEIMTRMQGGLPIDGVVLLLRAREDEDYYRAVNGYGIWAQTTRSQVDAPIMLEPPLTGHEPFPYAREVTPLQDMDQLIDSLR